MNALTQPRLLTLDDLDRAVQVQSAAFQDDPLWQYLDPDAQTRRRRLHKFFRPFFKFSIRNQQAYGAGDGLEGVAVWSLPVQPVKWSAVLLAGFPRLVFDPFMVQFVRAGKVFSQFARMQKQYAPDLHYYLETISVLPSAQGRGVASRLVKPFLDQADQQSVSVYTETMTPSNVGLYEHYGFKTMEDYRVPGTDLHIWSFYRPANPHR